MPSNSTKIILAVGAGSAVVVAVVVSMWYMQYQSDRAAEIHAAKLSQAISMCDDARAMYRSLDQSPPSIYKQYKPYDYQGCLNATKKLYGLQ